MIKCWLLILTIAMVSGCSRIEQFRLDGQPAAQVVEDEQLWQARLHGHIEVLSSDIGRRHLGEYANLLRAADYMEKTLAEMGYEVRSQRWMENGKEVRNLEATVAGRESPSEIVLIGAHYDSAQESPAANDNGTGVAALLELARYFKDKPQERTVRFALFANEEPPFFGGPRMGSWHYARKARERGDDIHIMISLETIGYYRDEPGTQHYPVPLRGVPDRADFVAFLTRWEDATLVQDTAKTFSESTRFPTASAAMPGWVSGVWFSDHWCFWKFRYPAIMVTDTAFQRYPYYHTPNDTIDKIDFPRYTRVARGMVPVVEKLASQ